MSGAPGLRAVQKRIQLGFLDRGKALTLEAFLVLLALARGALFLVAALPLPLRPLLLPLAMKMLAGHRHADNHFRRMPVLLAEKDFEPWLSGSAGLELLKPVADDVLQRWAVSKRVNSSRAPDESNAD